ncbi:hypothetical protein LWC34_28525 [Kibdelosporangium philippinense]|uniref:Uncharacterized protein n=1 Tax=Kibdelosporangium philippinense TaxID=211113 RepID=A0ABS8ZFY2_9PSEU|nr:hypothetical protein [Kibdelosporangium philippinense]MCE7006743.1 hypothetical protein [Kibdelosporangium philippinense]
MDWPDAGVLPPDVVGRALATARHQVHRFQVARAEAWTQSEAAENTHSQLRILISGPLVACVEVTFPQLLGEALLLAPDMTASLGPHPFCRAGAGPTAPDRAATFPRRRSGDSTAGQCPWRLVWHWPSPVITVDMLHTVLCGPRLQRVRRGHPARPDHPTGKRKGRNLSLAKNRFATKATWIVAKKCRRSHCAI